MPRSTLDLPLAWTTVYATSTTAVFLPDGDWGDAPGLKNAISLGEMRGRNGLCEAQPALQFSNYEDGTGAVSVGVGTNMTSDGYSPPAGGGATDLSTSYSPLYRLVRRGWLVKLTSGSTIGYARVAGVIRVVKA